METLGSKKVLEVLGFLNGDFITSQEGPRGLRMIFSMLFGFKQACLDFLPRIYIGITSKLTFGCSPDSIFRLLLGGLFLPFLLFMVYLHEHVYNTMLPHVTNLKEIWTLLYLSLFGMTVINYFAVLCSGAHDLNNKQDKAFLEETLKKDPVLSAHPSKCSKCDVPNTLRAFHCLECNSHTAKYNEHSAVFNKCIGAGNMLFFTTFQFFLTWLFLLAAIIIRLDKDETFKPGKPKKMLYNLLFVIYTVCAFGRLVAFLRNVVYIYYNITAYEVKAYQNLAYLWKSPRKEFFNPFDKGPAINLKEELYTIMNHQEESEKKSQSLDTTDTKELRETAEDPEDRDRQALNRERNKIVNWRKERILSLTDVYASPMRKIFLEFLNKKKNKKKGADSDSD